MNKTRNVRGRNYMKVFNEVKQDLLVAATGRTLSIMDVGIIARDFNLPIKTTFEYLEYLEVFPSGTWDRLVMRGLTAKKVKDAIWILYGDE